MMKQEEQVITLPETNMFTSENQWLEDEISFGKGHFQGQTCC